MISLIKKKGANPQTKEVMTRERVAVIRPEAVVTITVVVLPWTKKARSLAYWRGFIVFISVSLLSW